MMLHLFGFVLLQLVVFGVYSIGVDNNCPTEFVVAVRSGLWSCAKLIAESSAEDLRNVLDLETRGIVKELADVKKHLESTLPMDEINPAYQWAQSPDEIFLSVKFAHKLDTPGTLNVIAKNVTITENHLFLFASDGRKNFKLSIDFLKDINPDESTWSMASVGRMSFNIKKKSLQSNWARLMKDRKKTPNQHFWLEMHEKYAVQLNKLDDDTDDNTSKSNTNLKQPPLAKSKDEKVKPESTLKENSTFVAVETDANGTVANATIVNSTAVVEDNAEIEAMTKLEAEYKAALAQLETEAKAKRKEVDAKSKQEKQAIEKELVEKKRIALEKYQSDKDLWKESQKNKNSAAVQDA